MSARLCCCALISFPVSPTRWNTYKPRACTWRAQGSEGGLHLALSARNKRSAPGQEAPRVRRRQAHAGMAACGASIIRFVGRGERPQLDVLCCRLPGPAGMRARGTHNPTCSTRLQPGASCTRCHVRAYCAPLLPTIFAQCLLPCVPACLLARLFRCLSDLGTRTLDAALGIASSCVPGQASSVKSAGSWRAKAGLPRRPQHPPCNSHTSLDYKHL